MDKILNIGSLHYIILVTLVFFLGRLIKGTTGVGLPIFVISVLSNFMQPHKIMAILIIPIILSNMWLVYSVGQYKYVIKRFSPLIITLVLGTYIGTLILSSIPTKTLLLLIGVIVIIFCITNMVNPKISLPKHLEKWIGSITGLFAGLLFGISMVNGPPLMMYLISLKLDRELFVAAIAVTALTASSMLLLFYFNLGLMDKNYIYLSLLALIPVFCGLSVGKKLRLHIDQVKFRKLLIVLLFLVGINLIRHSLL